MVLIKNFSETISCQTLNLVQIAQNHDLNNLRYLEKIFERVFDEILKLLKI